MEIEKTGFADLHVLPFERYQDQRRYLMETFDTKAYQQLALDLGKSSASLGRHFSITLSANDAIHLNTSGNDPS